MNWRKTMYFAAHRATGGNMPLIYNNLVEEDHSRPHHEIALERLNHILAHSATAVPYYRDLFAERGLSPQGDPLATLPQLPILTKDLIRAHTGRLQSRDLAQRKWGYNTSGGSTGEPLQLIQDKDFDEQLVAMQMLYSTWVGVEVGDSEVSLWGFEREILQGSVGTKIILANLLTNRKLLNAFRMPPPKMRRYLEVLNTQRPKLIVAYAQAIYELACFAEQEGITVRQQRAIISTAGTLYPFLRQKIEAVFGCPVYNRYGSREVGDIAGECHVHHGLHVLPWGSYVEIVDEAGNVVPPGVEGRILVTCLTNYAMPLLRYDIGDRGALAEENTCPCGRRGQLLAHLAGRSVDTFRASDGTLISGSYFIHQLFYRQWVKKFQIVQRSTTEVLYRIVPNGQPGPQEDLDEIIAGTRVVMGPACAVMFEFVEDIPLLASGKYRYTISLVTS
jgi:phenylacetate-CoA ligase